jgi:hypothetical protein
MSASDLVLNRGLDKGKCRSCKADIVWAVTLTGKKSPFVPDPDGIYIIENGEARHVGAPPKQLELGAPAPAPRFTSHFADCPQQSDWRKPR